MRKSCFIFNLLFGIKHRFETKDSTNFSKAITETLQTFAKAGTAKASCVRSLLLTWLRFCLLVLLWLNGVLTFLMLLLVGLLVYPYLIRIFPVEDIVLN